MAFLGKNLYRKSNAYTLFGDRAVLQPCWEKIVEKDFPDLTSVKVRRMTFEPKLYTYYVSHLDDKGQRIDIGPNFKYLTEKNRSNII